MKKKILKVALVATFAFFAGYGVYKSQKSTDLSTLALDNVEALAKNFEWDGNNWDTDGHWYNSFGSNWTPTLVDCTVTEGVDYVVVHLTSYEGKMVVCSSGSGNCGIGSPCTAG